MNAFNLSTLPVAFDWQNSPFDWSVGPGDSLKIVAGERTDWFVDPATGTPQDNAPCALFTPPVPEFMLSARVKVAFASTFDAGVIQLRERDDLWAKLCFEYSPAGEPMIVSVVTRGNSDDCNSAVISGDEVYLRVAVMSTTIAFHYSTDGRVWRLVRYFSLGPLRSPRIGFSAQSPTGQQCTAEFSEIQWQPRRLGEVRSGE
ncbi:MAG: DUF1349 domain-containing protein [Planctomycetia bacterium]|nr:DUF1349 domain-containing protein [Planctomycetia bacterium]